MCVSQEGAHLVSILSPYEQGFIHGAMRWYNDHVQKHYNLWIGLNNLDVRNAMEQIYTVLPLQKVAPTRVYTSKTMCRH